MDGVGGGRGSWIGSDTVGGDEDGGGVEEDDVAVWAGRTGEDSAEDSGVGLGVAAAEGREGGGGEAEFGGRDAGGGDVA